jgi:23S rRNA-intervening sequence protein
MFIRHSFLPQNAAISPREISFMGSRIESLIAWQKAMSWISTKPPEPFRGMRFSAWPVRRADQRPPSPTNIAEGQAGFTGDDFFYFLGRARGALVEVETQLMIAQNLDYVSSEGGQRLLDKASELGKILNGLIASIRPAA